MQISHIKGVGLHLHTMHQSHTPFTAFKPRQIPHTNRKHHNRSIIVTAAASTAIAPFNSSTTVTVTDRRAQQTILEAIKDVKGRGKSGMTEDNQSRFDAAIAQLEKTGGLPRPTTSPLLEGRWRLLYTSRPGTASPIQRSFTGIESFSVFQEIDFATNPTARVNNVVDFGGSGYLKVEAEGSTDTRPIPGFTPRKGAGLPFGILGVSSTTPPAKSDLRVDFQFDKAAFYFRSLPFTIPYPVPFKLLGDERKGWIDITYLSPDGRFRLSRGNKGTLFVLVKDESPKEKLLNAIAAKGTQDDVIEELALDVAGTDGGVAAPAKSKQALGKWRLRWTKQGGTANPLQKALAGSVTNWQIITENNELENRVQLAPGLFIKAIAQCEADAPTRTGVVIDRVVLQLGPLELKLPINTDNRGFVDWLYLDDNMRITRGSKGSLFVHTRDD